MPKFIVEVEDGMEMFEVSEDAEKLEYIDSNEAYKTAIHEALRDYGFDSISVEKLEDTEKVMTEMYGGNTPIVPDETIEEWKEQGLLSETPTLPEMIEVNGVKYQRVEEPQKSKTLWERFYLAKWSDSACDEFCEIVKEWISQYGCDYNDRYAEGYEDALVTLKENLK